MMKEVTYYNIGKYTYSADQNLILQYSRVCTTVIENRIKTFDRILRRSLIEIFSEYCLGDSETIKEFLRSYRDNADHASLIEPILDKEPMISQYFLKEELKKLSLLWIAVLADYHKSAELLVSSGADVNEIFGIRNPQLIPNECTILHVMMYRKAFSFEDEQFIRLVADNGANLDAQDCFMKTVLHYSVMKSQMEITRIFLNKNVNVCIKDIYRKTALFYLLSPGDEDKLIEWARLLIENGISLNDRDENDHQPIHWAIRHGLFQLVDLFLIHGADPNAELDNSPLLHLMITSYCDGYPILELIEILLRHGADINIRDNSILRDTVLHEFCIRCPDLPEVLEVLLSAGADVLAESTNGETPFALLSNREEMYDVKRVFIQALALKKVTTELTDEKKIEDDPILYKYYLLCLKEIEKMRITWFFDDCTLLDILVKSKGQIAKLMRNPELDTIFSLCNLSEFPIYEDYFRQAYWRAQDHLYVLLVEENKINVALYNTLPHVVVRKFVGYIFDDPEAEL